MKRIWINYNLWEDYKNGLYSKNKQDKNIFEKVSDMFYHGTFKEYATEMLYSWPNSMDQNLSYSSSNRRSYLGQATACFKFGANIQTTCKVWESLDKETRDKANEIADEVINIYDISIYPTKEIKESNEELS